jgi:hypothetical protein
MAVHTTLEALMERVYAEDERKYDLLADTRRMSVESEAGEGESNVFLSIDQPTGITTLALTDHAMGQMATDLEIPKRYFDRMRVEAPGLFQTNVHHWLYDKPEKPRRKLVRAYTGEPEVGRAWLSDRYRRLDNIEIAKKLLPVLGELGTEVTFHNAAITDTKFYIRALFPRMEAEVKLGDAVQWGVQIKNSEVGDGQFDISNFVMRLACINGMVVAKVMSARHIGKRIGENLSDEAIRADDKAFWLAARDELKASLSEARFASVVASLRETTDGETISAPIAATERLAKQLSLSDGEKENVLLNLATGGDMTRWGALNAVTAAAKSADNFDRRVEMEELGWGMAEMTEKEWSRIAVAA